MRAVLTMLEEAASAGRLACFFWPAVNVLRQPTAARLQQLLRDVRYLRLRLLHDLPAVLPAFACRH